MMPLPRPTRSRLPFRSVNRRGAIDYDVGLQRHHLLPRQLLGRRCFVQLFEAVRMGPRDMDDFRRNGLLLPAHDTAVLRLGLPLHRGPHRHYNAMVIERVGRIEAGWAEHRLRAPERARNHALMRIDLLQRALRRRLLHARAQPFALNSRDPLGRTIDFSDLDTMADALWSGTAAAAASEG